MIKLLSLEFWLGFQFFIDLVLLGLFMLLFSRLKKRSERKDPRENFYGEAEMGNLDGGAEEAGMTATQIIDMLEPLVKEADSAAISFDQQIRDKRSLIRGLNESLDSRIISINLLLSRAESTLSRANNVSDMAPRNSSPLMHAGSAPGEDVFDQQKSIVALYDKGFNVDAIASRLSMPKGEVQLVISLKKKFMAMETPE